VTNQNVKPTHTLTDDRLEASRQFSLGINDTPRSRGVTFLVTGPNTAKNVRCLLSAIGESVVSSMKTTLKGGK